MGAGLFFCFGLRHIKRISAFFGARRIHSFAAHRRSPLVLASYVCAAYLARVAQFQSWGGLVSCTIHRFDFVEFALDSKWYVA